MRPLLEILKDGEFHSGDAIGRILGVGRAAVWKKLQHLRSLGLCVDSVKGRGYRLSVGTELLDSALISRLSVSVTDEASVRCLISVDSTNSYVLKGMSENSARSLFCFAEHQTSGRGRRGREWLSPFGANLYLSTHKGFSKGASGLEGLSLVVGLAVRRAITKLVPVSLMLKWPNDVLWQGKKLGGILLEIGGDPAGECEVIIGIGINLNLNDEHRELISQPCVDLYEIAGKKISKNALAATLIDELEDALTVFERSGFSVFMDEWEECDAFSGNDVGVQVAAGKWIEGVCRGVDQKGALLVESAGELIAYHGGEVSLRRRSNDS